MNILMIDKGRPLTRFYSRMLENAGFSVIDALSMREAHRICRSTSFDLVIMAAHLPWQQFVDSLVVLREECPMTKIIAFGPRMLIDNLDVEKCLKACSVKAVKGENPSLMALLTTVNQELGEPRHQNINSVYA